MDCMTGQVTPTVADIRHHKEAELVLPLFKPRCQPRMIQVVVLKLLPIYGTTETLATPSAGLDMEHSISR